MEGLKIVGFDGEGYYSPYSFENWKIAFLNYAEKFTRSGICYLERHMETAEVFVLLHGKATLLIGEEATEVTLKKDEAYIVEQSVWHNIILEEDTKILIVENSDTGRENSEYMPVLLKDTPCNTIET